jgi:hypothetical protein
VDSGTKRNRLSEADLDVSAKLLEQACSGMSKPKHFQGVRLCVGTTSCSSASVRLTELADSHSRRRNQTMNELSELIPLVSGIAIGLLCYGMAPGRRRALTLGVLSIICGLGATVISGEFRQSWGYLLLDIPLTAGMALATMFTPPVVARLVQLIRG